MLEYNIPYKKVLKGKHKEIYSFRNDRIGRLERKTIISFGKEWSKFYRFNDEEIKAIGDEYFDIVTSEILHPDSIVLDIGCGTGRWTKYMAPKVSFVEAVDPSDSVYAADFFLQGVKNVRLTQAGIDEIPFKDESFDFVMCIGVLHHLPNAFLSMKKCLEKLKPGGFFYVYLYYNLEDRGAGYKLIYFFSDMLRRVLSHLPSFLKKISCDFLSIFIYIPFIWTGRFLNKFSFLRRFAHKLPLSYYWDKSFYVIRSDSLDRFGTPLEKRFSKEEVRRMLETAGLIDIIFSPNMPRWHVVAKKI